MIKNFLNPEGHQNPISGSKVTAILLKRWILPIGGAREGSAPAACAASLFFPWQDLETSFIYIFLTYEASVWPIRISVWKPYTKHVHVLNFITEICFTKHILCFTKRGICLYQTEPNKAGNGALLYVCLSLYAVSSQPCLQEKPWWKLTFTSMRKEFGNEHF